MPNQAKASWLVTARKNPVTALLISYAFITLLASIIFFFISKYGTLPEKSILHLLIAYLWITIGFIIFISIKITRQLASFQKLQTQYEDENTALNNGVISLLHGVHKLSQKDLTVEMEITEDATAPITDSLNLLIKDTAKVLQEVVFISNDMADFCASVREHSETVTQYSQQELAEVDSANTDLDSASSSMRQVAELAIACDESATLALQSTAKAKDSVINTVNGIERIREIIRETEKRIKRLGERSQEISGIVSLINSISERTHVLALNASIHATSSGESGKSFVVIAEEVQRLAENSRESTSQISSLVNNIQLETNKAVKIMNDVITEVVEGTRLANTAGEQMQETLTRTDQLVGMVKTIKQSSEEQLNIASQLTQRAKSIQESTNRTGDELSAQKNYIDKLVSLSQKLVESISVFKLPDTKK